LKHIHRNNIAGFDANRSKIGFNRFPYIAWRVPVVAVTDF
jgi:hypothetical protein